MDEDKCYACKHVASECAWIDEQHDAFADEVRRLSENRMLTHQEALEWLQQRREL